MNVGVQNLTLISVVYHFEGEDNFSERLLKQTQTSSKFKFQNTGLKDSCGQKCLPEFKDLSSNHMRLDK